MRLYLLALVPVTLAAAHDKASLLANQTLTFEQNRGQFPDAAPGAFVARASGYVFVAAPTGPVFLTPAGPVPFTLDGAAPWSAPQPVHRLIRQSNYFRPNLQLTGVPHFASVRYPNVYPGIDLIFKAAGRDIEYDFLVHPHADPSRIAVRLPGAPALRQRPPVAFQQTPRGRVEIPIKTRQSGPVTRFHLAPYDPSLPLTIDPVVEASTLFGAIGEETPKGLAVDAAGNFIVVGRTWLNFLSATPGAYQTSGAGSGDAFITKIAADAKTVLFTTYLGSVDEDIANAVALDPSGNIVVTGNTASNQFPITPGAWTQPTRYGGAFVAKLNPNGNQLLLSLTLNGAGGNTWSNAVALDASGNIYFGGRTTSPNLPTTAGVLFPTFPGEDDNAFAAKLNPAGSSLLFLTYLGGRRRGAVTSIAVTPDANPIFAGYSTNYGVPSLDITAPEGAVRRLPGNSEEGFAFKLNPTATAILAGSYLGGLASDRVHSVATDAAGNIYLAGLTFSTDFPTSANAVRKSVLNYDTSAAFVTKWNATATAMSWSTLLGGNAYTIAHALAVDPDGKAYVTGETAASDFNLAGAPLISSFVFNTTGAFLSAFDATGALVDSTFWIGTNRGSIADNASRGVAIARNASGVVSVLGGAAGVTFPVTPGALRPVITTSASPDVFVTRFSYASPCTYSVSPPSIQAPIAGGVYRATVTTSPGCPWTHAASAPWYGTRFVSETEADITVDESVESLLTGAVFIAGKTIPITQQGACVYSTPNPIAPAPNTGGPFSFKLTTNLRCPLAPTTTADWIDLTPTPQFNLGTADVTVQLRTNYGAARSGVVNFAPGVSVRIDQAANACSYSVSLNGPLQVGYGFQAIPVTVTTATGCPWQGSSSVDWMDHGTTLNFPMYGTSTATLSIGYNSGALRTGTITYAGKVISVTQLAQPVGNAPTLIFPAPRLPAGSPQQFAIGGRDNDGAADIARIQFLVADGPSATPGNSCYGYFTPATNSLYLYNDNHTATLGPITRGVAGALENSFCRLDGLTSAPFSAAGTDAFVNFGLSLKGVFGSKQHEVYGWVRDAAGNDTGWARVDTWKVAPFSQIPAITPATPFALAGTPKVLYGQATDGDGGANITRLFFNIGPSATPSASTCYGYLDNTNNTAVLLDNSAANCAFSSNVTSIIPAGNEVNFTLSLNLRGALASGTHTVFVNARDAQNNESGWTSLGTWSPANPPSLDANAPIATSGADQTFTFTFDHPEGVANLGVVNVLINRFLDGNGACYVAFSQPLNVLYLVNDNGPGSGLSAGLTLGGSGSVSNTQCRINAAGSSAARSGNRLTLTLNVTFFNAFSGSKVIYLAAGAANGTNTGWRTSGAHQVPAPISYPNPASLTPASGSSGIIYPEMVFEDTASYTNLQTAWMLINTALDGRGACYVAYYRPGNTLYLIPDNGDGNQAQSIPLAGGNTLSNSQCTVSALNSTVTVSGNRLTLRLQVQFQSAFAGPKVIWTAVSTLNNAAVSPWKASGAWTVTR